MPQTTLMGYFTPIQPGVIELQKTPTPLLQNPVDHPISKPIDLVKQSEILSRITREKNDDRTVQEKIESNNPRDGCTDFFAPPNQPQATVVKVSSSHLARLKAITNTLLPVRYPDKFFNECVENEVIGKLSRVVLWNSQPVGWIRCRLEDTDKPCKQVYVQALGVLAPYRGYGLATNLIDQVTQKALIREFDLTSVYCHVWEANTDTLEWYERRGFRRVILIQNYYRKLKPSGAWIIRKELT